MVHPIPNAATYLALRLKLYIIPIFLEIAYRITHSMGILAEEEGTVLLAGITIDTLHARHTWVHAAIHISHLVHPLVMYHTAIQFLDSLLASHEIAASSTFITHTPEDDAWMIAVAQDHADLTIDIHRLPTLRAAKRVIPMTLYISLIHHVETIAVAEFIEIFSVRIMRGTNEVDVGLLH